MQHLLGAEIVFRNSQFGWVRFHCLISVISGPKFTELLSPNAGGIMVQNVLVRFWIFSFALKIFTSEVWSRPKLGQMLHVYGL